MKLAPQTGVAFGVLRGQEIRVMDPEGQQVADLFCVDAQNRADALSSGRSIDYNETVYFTTGHMLFAHSGNPMLEIIADSCGIHDFLVTPCSLQMFRMLDPKCEYHPSCEENLIRAFAPFAISPMVITTTFNIFMNVPIRAQGKITVETPGSKAGDFVRFKAKRDLIIGLTACSDEGSNAGRCKPIEFEISP